MKIGVVTFWYGNENYGMMLQCWALQQYLKQLGHDPYVIRFVPERYKSSSRKRKETITLYPLLRWLYRKCIYILHIKENRDKSNKIAKRGFESFRKSHLTLSSRYYTNLQQLQKNPPQADCYIVGSDQVWSQLLSNPNNKGYFLDFGAPSVKRVAYAPSFGLPDYPEELKQNLKACLSKFDAISVRENVGVEICASVGYNASRVLDPTLLLDKGNYQALFKHIKTNNQKFIFIYCLNISGPEDIRFTELKEYALEKSQAIIVTPGKGYYQSSELFNSADVTYSYDTIEEWLSHVFNSSLVVTSSFHGIVLSLILEKDFIFVPLKGEFAHTNNRVLDLLRDLELEFRILNDSTSYQEIQDTSIPWNVVTKKLESYKKYSQTFLLNNLRNK